MLRDVGSPVQTVYEFAGPRVLERLLDALRRGRARRTWDWVAGLGKAEVEGSGTRYVMEPELTGGIAYGELNYGAPPDGHPLDPQVMFAAQARREQSFSGEPFDLRAELPRFGWPTAVVSGDRDLRTPRTVATEVASLLPDGVLVPLPGLGHSALDTHGLAALHVAHAVGAGGHRKLPVLADRIGALPRVGATRVIGPMIRARLAADLLRS